MALLVGEGVRRGRHGSGEKRKALVDQANPDRGRKTCSLPSRVPKMELLPPATRKVFTGFIKTAFLRRPGVDGRNQLNQIPRRRSYNFQSRIQKVKKKHKSTNDSADADADDGDEDEGDWSSAARKAFAGTLRRDP